MPGSQQVELVDSYGNRYVTSLTDDELKLALESTAKGHYLNIMGKIAISRPVGAAVKLVTGPRAIETARPPAPLVESRQG